MMEVCHITEQEVGELNPISYSIIYESAVHKQYWCVSFSGERQGLLCATDGRVQKFMSEEEARKFCEERWSDLRLI